MSLPARLSVISFSEVSGTLFAQTKISTSSSHVAGCCRCRIVPNHLSIHQLGQVDRRHLSFKSGDLDRVFEVDHAKWARSDDHVRASLRGHLYARHAHALFLFGLVKQHQAATATAEGTVTRTLHLDALESRDGVEYVAWIVINIIVATEIARVVVGVDLVGALDGIETDQPRCAGASDDLADVLDGWNIFIVVSKRIEGMRIGCHDLLYSGSLDGIGVMVAQSCE